jgi:lysophospholipase L1-like esterase
MNTPEAQRPRTRHTGPSLAGRIALVLFSLLVGLGLIELGVRAWTWSWLFAWPNQVAEARRVIGERDAARYVHDERLGHVPREGLRGNGAVPAGTGAPILAVGDSFTFGDEVGDGETWPAELQRLTGRPVLNAGVSGYGFDQIVLRAEALAPIYRPQAIVVAFIADDIRRTEMRRLWSADKPWFEIAGGQPVLRGVPVPPRAPAAETLSFWQRTLGYSFALDFILRRLDLLHDWYGDHVRVHPAGTGEQIACLLTARLAELQKTAAAPVLVVAEYDPVVWDDATFAARQRRLTAGLLACARKNGLATLDTYEALAATGQPRKLYVLWHMNGAGNALVARLIAGALGAKRN